MHLVKSLLALTLAVTVCRALQMSVYRSFPTPLEFLRLVVSHEFDWGLILKEKVKNLEPVPYEDRFPDVIDPIQMDTRAIVLKVLYEYSHIGSFVNYAAAAVHKSLSCYSVKQLAFQSHYLTRMFDKQAEAGVILLELSRIKQTTNMILDKLTIFPTDLSIVFDMYWEAIRLMQYDVVQYVRFQIYPIMSKAYMDILHKRIINFLTTNCAKPLLDGQFLFDMNIKVNYLLMDEVLNLIVDLPELKRLSQEHENFVTTYYMSLGYDMLPRLLWNQIFYYSKPIPRNELSHETNPPIITYQPLEEDKPVNTNQPVNGNPPLSGSII